MTVILPQFRFAYFAVPKAACTTVKTILFEAENQVALSSLMLGGAPIRVHTLYPTRLFSEINKKRVASFAKLTVIRDPIERFVSAHRNRVFDKDEITNSRHAERFRKQGLSLRPSLSEFIEHIAEYRAVWGIEHHISPLTSFLGRDPSYFDYVYDISDLGEAIQRVSEITGWTGKELTLNRSGKHRHAESELTREQRLFLEDFYAEDYEIFGKYFKRD